MYSVQEYFCFEVMADEDVILNYTFLNYLTLWGSRYRVKIIVMYECWKETFGLGVYIRRADSSYKQGINHDMQCIWKEYKLKYYTHFVPKHVMNQ